MRSPHSVGRFANDFVLERRVRQPRVLNVELFQPLRVRRAHAAELAPPEALARANNPRFPQTSFATVRCAVEQSAVRAWGARRANAGALRLDAESTEVGSQGWAAVNAPCAFGLVMFVLAAAHGQPHSRSSRQLSRG